MKKTNKIILIIAIILIIVVLGVVVYFGIKNKQDSDKKIGVLENQIAELKNNNENNNKTANNDMNNENQISNYVGIDWEQAKANAKAPEEQKEERNNGVIGIGTDGEPVNMDLWRPYKGGKKGWKLMSVTTSYGRETSVYRSDR